MSELETWIADLRSEWIHQSKIDRLYGITVLTEEVVASLIAWSKRIRRPREIVRDDGEWINRHGFESYLQFRKILPTKLAAARVGMTETTLAEILSKLHDEGYLIITDEFFVHHLVSESILRELSGIFPELRNRIFTDHDDFCLRLHHAINSNLGIIVDSIHCKTSVACGHENPDFAYSYDILTNEPMGIRYEVWLELGKPMNLRPDACSMLTYKENTDILRPLVFVGQEPQLPEGL